MTELRRSSRVRQSAKHSPQYYEPDEKKGILAAPDVRPRKWRAADVAVGYFTLRKWVPKDQQHLTADLHGGLTDKAEIVAAAKLALRSGNRTFTRGRSRSRGGSSGGLSRGRGGGINRAGGRSSPGDSSGASFGGAGAGGWGGAQGYAPPPPGPSVPPTAATGGGAFLGGTAASGKAQSRVLQQPERVGGKRPAAAVVGGTSEHEPPLQSRRISDDSSPRLPGPTGARSSAGAPLGPWAGQAQSLGTTQLGNGLVRGGQAGETACLAGGTAVGAGRGVGAMWGAGGSNGAVQPPWNNTAV